MNELEVMASAHDATGYVKAAVEKGRQRLSPALLATLASEGTLAGYSSDGRWVISGSQSTGKALMASGLVRSVEPEKDAKFLSLEELTCIYDLERKPDSVDLAKAGFEVTKERERRNFGYLNVKVAGGTRGISAEVIKRIKNIPGIVEVDANASIAIGHP
jgi:hypothetical protein